MNGVHVLSVLVLVVLCFVHGFVCHLAPANRADVSQFHHFVHQRAGKPSRPVQCSCRTA